VCEMSSRCQCCSQSEHRSPAATDTTASVIEPWRLQEETRPDMTGHHRILCDKSCVFISLDDWFIVVWFIVVYLCLSVCLSVPGSVSDEAVLCLVFCIQ